jgi:TatD DNase family protein
MIDSHCHLNFSSISDNFEEIISNAIKNNITSILTINTEPDNFLSHYKLILNYKSIFISYGLHPENVSKNNIITKDQIIFHSKKDKVIGIGETGLDFYRSVEFKKEQYASFENHIEASIETDLPLIIHQRNSENEIIEILTKYQKIHELKIVLHCFTGSENLKKFCLDNNYYISLSGIITFKNASSLRDIIKDIPISSLLIETDSPFLSPEPFRGKHNQPSFVKHIGEYLSEFYKIPFQTLTLNTDNNFYNLFNKAIRYSKLS